MMSWAVSDCKQRCYEAYWCRRGDSNPHELPHTPLKRARLPVPPLRLIQEGCQKTRNPIVSRYLFGVAVGVSVADGDCVGCGVAVGDGVGTAGCSGIPDCKTEL